MAAMKPRVGDGPLEIDKSGRTYVVKIPVEGGGRLAIAMNTDEMESLGNLLLAMVPVGAR